MRWSKVFKRNGEKGTSALDRIDKVVVFGGGSFGTAMGTALARQRGDLQVTLLLRDPYICNNIVVNHVNTRYLKVCSLLILFPTIEDRTCLPELGTISQCQVAHSCKQWQCIAFIRLQAPHSTLTCLLCLLEWREIFQLYSSRCGSQQHCLHVCRSMCCQRM